MPVSISSPALSTHASRGPHRNARWRRHPRTRRTPSHRRGQCLRPVFGLRRRPTPTVVCPTPHWRLPTSLPNYGRVGSNWSLRPVASISCTTRPHHVGNLTPRGRLGTHPNRLAPRAAPISHHRAGQLHSVHAATIQLWPTSLVNNSVYYLCSSRIRG